MAQKGFGKGGQNLQGDPKNLLSITVKADLSDLFLLVKEEATA